MPSFAMHSLTVNQHTIHFEDNSVKMHKGELTARVAAETLDPCQVV